MARYGTNHRGGRPKGTNAIRAEKLREFIIEKVRQDAPLLYEAKRALALGHKKEITNDDGVSVVYTQSPDAGSIRYLLDQGIGRAKETVEVESDVVLKVDF